MSQISIIHHHLIKKYLIAAMIYSWHIVLLVLFCRHDIAGTLLSWRYSAAMIYSWHIAHLTLKKQHTRSLSIHILKLIYSFFTREVWIDISLSYKEVRVMVPWWLVLLEETGVAGENNRPFASLWQTVSLNVVSNTPRMSGIRIHNLSGDRYWLQIQIP